MESDKKITVCEFYLTDHPSIRVKYSPELCKAMREEIERNIAKRKQKNSVGKCEESNDG